MREPTLVTISCFVLLLCISCPLCAATITVDASTCTGDVNQRILGYGLDYKLDAWGLWDPTTKALKETGADVVDAAGLRPQAMLRFYGSDTAETYHWRRVKRGRTPPSPGTQHPTPS